MAVLRASEGPYVLARYGKVNRQSRKRKGERVVKVKGTASAKAGIKLL